MDPEHMEDEAKAVFMGGNSAKASDLFTALLEEYRISGDLALVGEMANNACVAFIETGKPQMAVEVLRGIEEIFEKSGDTRRLAITLGNQAAAYEGIKEYQKALDFYRKAVVLFEEVQDVDLYSITLSSLSVLLLKMGKPLEAVTALEIGLKKIDKPNLKLKFLGKMIRIPQNIVPWKQKLSITS